MKSKGRRTSKPRKHGVNRRNKQHANNKASRRTILLEEDASDTDDRSKPKVPKTRLDWRLDKYQVFEEVFA